MRGVVWMLVGACGGSSGHPDAVGDAAGDAAIDAAPATAPDLRFHWVGAETAFQQIQVTNIGYSHGSGVGLSHAAPSEYSWSPLQLSLTGPLAGSYAWFITDFTPPQKLETMLAMARAGRIETLTDDLAAHLDGREILVSLDILPDAYAIVTNGTAAGVPAYQATWVDQSRVDLDGWIASEAAAGRVVTALSVSPSAGNLRAYSFSRDGDSTAYETRVLDASAATLVAQATVLADAGYVITAFGRVGDDASILVGTRTPGASPRMLSVQMMTTGVPDLHAGDAIVAWVFNGPGLGSTVVLER